MIAEHGGFLEFEIFGRLLHLFFDIGDQFEQFIFAQRTSIVWPSVVGGFFVGHSTQPLGQVADAFDDAFWFDAMLKIIGFLDATPPFGFVDRVLHRWSHIVAVHQHRAVNVPRRSANRLN